ncbi:MAG: hypothetical protein ACU0A9_03005, partial [Alterinioella nitratireducens]|uniref:hypothetical protein n=1 Tax=Alterinioella nitratireducens TaxID=2735915 RepID=UPI00405918FF
QAPARRIAGNAAAVDTAADDEEIVDATHGGIILLKLASPLPFSVRFVNFHVRFYSLPRKVASAIK